MRDIIISTDVCSVRNRAHVLISFDFSEKLTQLVKSVAIQNKIKLMCGFSTISLPSIFHYNSKFRTRNSLSLQLL